MDSSTLAFSNFERLPLGRPVSRLDYIAEACKGRVVLDIGCLDETALSKRETQHWLHGRIAAAAARVIGLDSSSAIPEEGIRTGSNSRIHRCDVTEQSLARYRDEGVHVIVAGEFIEHIENPVAFLRTLRRTFPGCELILSTPNGASLSNTVMGFIGREAQHPDHLHSYTFKTLHTACARAGFRDWEIVPCRFFATEMLLTATGLVRIAAQVTQVFIQTVTHVFPLLSSGYIVRARL